MMPRRLPLRPDTVILHRALAVPVAPVPWSRKALAIALHASGLALFGLIVVWPVVSPIASGELAQEFKPVFEALAAWSAPAR